MRAVTRLLTVLTLCALAAVGGRGVAAQNVLAYWDDCGGSPDIITPAVNNIPGATLSLTTVLGTFSTMAAAPPAGGWDVMIMAVYGNFIDAASLDALNAHAMAGGRVIFWSWEALAGGVAAPHPLFTTTCPVSFVTDYQTPKTLEAWDPMNAMFTTPNLLTFPAVPPFNNCNTDGQDVEPMGGSMALAGYTPVPTPNQAAIVVSPGGEVILNAFVVELYDAAFRQGLLENQILWQSIPRPTCTVTGPAMLASGDVTFTFDAQSASAMMVDLTFEYSTDMGMTFNPCTPAASSPTPNPAIAVPLGPGSFEWDTVTDAVGATMLQTGVVFRISVIDGVSPTPGVCEAMLDVDNRATCTVAGPMGTAMGDITVDVTTMSTTAMMVDLAFEHSVDGGATWSPSTATAASPLANPVTGVPLGLDQFFWDSRADGVATMAITPGVLFRATVTDPGSGGSTTCTTAAFDVDNTALCGGLCGDCDLNMNGPDILDALTAAQAAAGLITPTMTQAACCDVNASMSVDILDALSIAQEAAGLSPMLTCL